MRKLILSALALAALGLPARANDYACMRDGPGSVACEVDQMEKAQQNERRREQAERAREAQRCQFTRCY